MKQTHPQAPTSANFAAHAARPGILQRKCACGDHAPGGECDSCRKKRDGATMQRSPLRGEAAQGAPPLVHHVLQSPGQPLDAAARADMEPRFGHDFSGVRVHTDSRAAESARAVHAHAYTVGRDIVFGAGEYAPGSAAGRQLLAHELTHVLQQSHVAPSGRAASEDIRIAPPADAAERQADAIASGVLGRPAPDTAEIRKETLSPLSSVGGNNAVQRQTLQRQTKRPAAASASRGAPIVEDNRPIAAGQMRRSQFLTTLRETLIRECEIELAPFGRTAKDCPYIVRTLERQMNLPLASVMALIQRFGKPPAGADANGLIRAVTQRARIVARRVAEKRGKRLQAMTESGAASLTLHDPMAIHAQLGSGRPLDDASRDGMETSFGTSFDAVRIHADSTAARLNRELGARAFTVGKNIAFAEGEYRPGTTTGDTLLAHELAHTLQQGTGTPSAGRGAANDMEMERQADRAASAAIAGRSGEALSPHVKLQAHIQPGQDGMRIQRWPVVIAGALVVGEVGTEAVVITEVATVTTEVVVADGALTLTAAELPALATPAVEAALPAAVEATSTSAVTSSTFYTAATIGTGIAATTLSSDSPQTSEPEKQRKCRETYPTALLCEEEISMDEQVQEFLLRQGYGYESLGDCVGFRSHGAGVIDDCSGAPGESFHCDVRPYFDPVARVRKPGGSVSIFSCLCCRPDGTTGFEFRGAHWSPGAP